MVFALVGNKFFNSIDQHQQDALMIRLPAHNNNNNKLADRKASQICGLFPSLNCKQTELSLKLAAFSDAPIDFRERTI